MIHTLQVEKRNGKIEAFDISKISKALGNIQTADWSDVAQAIQIHLVKKHLMADEDQPLVPVNEIHACVLYQLMTRGLSDVATQYLNYRAKSQSLDIALLKAKEAIPYHPSGDLLKADLLRQKITDEVTQCLGERLPGMTVLGEAIRRGVDLGLINPELLDYDVWQLDQHITARGHMDLPYLGLQTLYDRYLLKDKTKGLVFETPEIMFMRVAMGVALAEKVEDRSLYVYEFYNIMHQKYFMPSTPTLFNAGTVHSQLSSCYLTTVGDSLHSIYADGYYVNAQLSKYAGGLGNDWTPVRSAGSHIHGTNGESQGVVPFLKVQNSSCVAVNQGGKRKGAACAYLEMWHGDIEDFLELKKNSGEERRRCHDLNTAVWVPDLFMHRVVKNEDWTLFSPSDFPDLHELYGKDFELAYTQAEKTGKGRKISATALWRKLLGCLFETGHPWITFKDRCNLANPQKHVGVIHSSNLCTEITLNTSKDEVAVCNLGSLVLPNLFRIGGIAIDDLRKVVHTAVRMLDNVIDINFYPVPQAETSNRRHRPIGLGMMGLQDVFFQNKLPFESSEARHLSNHIAETISQLAYEASAYLAFERGPYPSFLGSEWDKGKMVYELNSNETYRPGWTNAQHLIRQYGLRNSNLLAIAPTATIANIVGVTSSIEPIYQNLYVKSTLSGDFVTINPYLVLDLEAYGIPLADAVEVMKADNGSVRKLNLPEDVKALYKTAFEIDPLNLIDLTANRQRFIDQAQSLNLFVAEPSGKKLHDIYMHAWRSGLKTTYYLKSRAKS